MTEVARVAPLALTGWEGDEPLRDENAGPPAIRQNFIDAVLDGTALVAPAEEGIHSVELANAMIYSSLLGQPVDLPIDGAAYEAALQRLIAESTFEKQVTESGGDSWHSVSTHLPPVYSIKFSRA